MSAAPRSALIGEPPRRSPPNRRELLHALVRIEDCLRRGGARWRDVPAKARADLLKGANEAAHLLWRARLR